MLFDATRLIWRRWAGRRPTGIDRVCLAYLQHFGGECQAVVHHRRFRRILDRQASAALFAMLAEPARNFRAGLLLAILRFGARRDNPANGRLYLNIGHTGLDDPGFRDWVGRTGVRPIYFVHDLIPITYPQFCRAGESERHERRMETVLATAAGVIANSRDTLDQLGRFGARRSLPSPPTLAAWLGNTPLPPPKPSRPAADCPTFVTLGTIEARKNHLLLLRIWSRLVARLGDRAPRLLIIGQRGWECDVVFDLLDRSGQLGGSVVEIGGAGDQAIADALADARALLFPSLAEGFGMPLVEALGAGTPAIASELPVFREIGQGVPDLIDSGDETAWERTILDYADEASAARSAQLQRLKDYRPPSWDDHFSSVESWLEQF